MSVKVFWKSVSELCANSFPGFFFMRMHNEQLPFNFDDKNHQQLKLLVHLDD